MNRTGVYLAAEAPAMQPKEGKMPSCPLTSPANHSIRKFSKILNRSVMVAVADPLPTLFRLERLLTPTAVADHISNTKNKKKGKKERRKKGKKEKRRVMAMHR